MCRSRSVERKKGGSESGGRRVPKGYHHFIAQRPVVPPGLELIGARLTFQWDIMTPSAPTHLWIGDIGRGRFPRLHAESDYLVLDCLATTLARWGKNSMCLKTPPGHDICLYVEEILCVLHLVVKSISNRITRGRKSCCSLINISV